MNFPRPTSHPSLPLFSFSVHQNYVLNDAPSAQQVSVPEAVSVSNISLNGLPFAIAFGLLWPASSPTRIALPAHFLAYVLVRGIARIQIEEFRSSFVIQLCPTAFRAHYAAPPFLVRAYVGMVGAILGRHACTRLLPCKHAFHACFLVFDLFACLPPMFASEGGTCKHAFNACLLLGQDRCKHVFDPCLLLRGTCMHALPPCMLLTDTCLLSPHARTLVCWVISCFSLTEPTTKTSDNVTCCWRYHSNSRFYPYLVLLPSINNLS